MEIAIKYEKVPPGASYVSHLDGELVTPVIGQYAGYAADVWSSTGEHYNLLDPVRREAATKDPDEFVRNMAAFYGDKPEAEAP